MIVSIMMIMMIVSGNTSFTVLYCTVMYCSGDHDHTVAVIGI